jgi:hypothetical protein
MSENEKSGREGGRYTEYGERVRERERERERERKSRRVALREIVLVDQSLAR